MAGWLAGPTVHHNHVHCTTTTYPIYLHFFSLLIFTPNLFSSHSLTEEMASTPFKTALSLLAALILCFSVARCAPKKIPSKIGNGYRLISVEEAPGGGIVGHLEVKSKNNFYGPDISHLRLFVKSVFIYHFFNNLFIGRHVIVTTRVKQTGTRPKTAYVSTFPTRRSRGGKYRTASSPGNPRPVSRVGKPVLPTRFFPVRIRAKV